MEERAAGREGRCLLMRDIVVCRTVGCEGRCFWRVFLGVVVKACSVLASVVVPVGLASAPEDGEGLSYVGKEREIACGL